jgi:hypothetical protein
LLESPLEILHTINHVNDYTYLGVRITKDGNCEPEITDRINKGRASITQLNGILWDRDVTPQNKDPYLPSNSKKHNNICGRNMVFKC